MVSSRILRTVRACLLLILVYTAGTYIWVYGLFGTRNKIESTSCEKQTKIILIGRCRVVSLYSWNWNKSGNRVDTVAREISAVGRSRKIPFRHRQMWRHCATWYNLKLKQKRQILTLHSQVELYAASGRLFVKPCPAFAAGRTGHLGENIICELSV